MHIYDNISLGSYYNEKCFRQICTENESKHFMLNRFFPNIVPFVSNVEKYDILLQAADDMTPAHGMLEN